MCPLVISDHLPTKGRLTLDPRACLLLILKLLTMLFGSQDIDRREDTQPTDPTNMEQAAPVPKALQFPFKTDHKGSFSGNLNVLPPGQTNSREYIKDRKVDRFKVDHLSQTSATPTVRVHGRVGGASERLLKTSSPPPGFQRQPGPDPSLASTRRRNPPQTPGTA